MIGGCRSGKGHEKRTGRVRVPSDGWSSSVKIESRSDEWTDENLDTCRQAWASSALQLPYEKGSERARGRGREIGAEIWTLRFSSHSFSRSVEALFTCKIFCKI